MFDQYIGIDWSGALSPIRSDKIAVATCARTSSSHPIADDRSLSRTDVFNHILDLATTDRRTLVGIDCNLGYCYAVGKHQFGSQADYLKLWEAVETACDNQANFFAGPFWQVEENAGYFWTKGKQPSWFDLQTLRRKTEACAAERGLGIPESPFKLIGAKQVGKGGLAGMRMALKLKQTLGEQITFWPFEDVNAEKTKIVVTEIYPRLFIRYAGFGNAKIRDAEQLNTILQHYQLNPFGRLMKLSDHLTDAIIASAGLRWFCQQRDMFTREKLPADAVQFEGWIFGVEP
ncbi:MAG: hypothetical protein AAGJ37_00775 [Pseudomonadota bacterium]